jgi:hypothetical protein
MQTASGGVSVLFKSGSDRSAALLKAIIPFIPLTADLKNGHEESVN